MKVFAVFDTNILVSALISRRSDTAVVHALEALLSGEVIPLYNDEIFRNTTRYCTGRGFISRKDLLMQSFAK